MNSHGKKNLIQEIDNEFVTLTEENTIKVRFVETQAHHRPGDDIFVVYEICNGFKPSSRDWIGLYSAANKGVNDYLNFQWAPRHARDEKFPHIRGVLFPAGEVDITPSATAKYLFMYISKANQILAESQKFYISDIDPESGLDLECVEDHYGDYEDFTLIQSRPEKEQGNFEVVKDWAKDEPATSGQSDSPVKKVSDHVSLTAVVGQTGLTLLEIFSQEDEKALLPYGGSGPVVLYNSKETKLPTDIIELVKEIEERRKHPGILAVPAITESATKESPDKDVDLEALEVELEYVDNNLNEQRNLVKELTSQVQNLSSENKNLGSTNENLCRNLRTVTNKKESVESELTKCNGKIDELRTVVRLQKKGNRTLEEECRKAKEEAKRSQYEAERLRSDINLLEQQKSDLEDSLAQQQQQQQQQQHLDINGNVKLVENTTLEEAAEDSEGWTVATSRKTDRKQKLIEKLERKLAEEKEKCEELGGKLKECEDQIQQLQVDIKDHQKEEQKLVEQICEEKTCSKELDSRAKELTAEMEKMKKQNDRLTQEVALVKRQKMRVKRHLVEREEELITRIQSLEDALKASKLMNKKVKRQCETYSQTSLQTSNTNTQTPKTKTENRSSLTDKVCGPVQVSKKQDKKNDKKFLSWEEYFENFKNAWWTENKKPEEAASSQTSKQSTFVLHDSLFPFPVFPLAENEELPNQKQVEEPLDLTMKRSANEQSSSGVLSPSLQASTSEASAFSTDSGSSSWSKQVEDETEELLPFLGSFGGRDLEERDPREKKKISARKAAAYMVSKQPKPQGQMNEESSDEQKEPKTKSKKSGTKKLARRFVCHTRRFRFPGGASSSRGQHVTKGNPPVSPLSK